MEKKALKLLLLFALYHVSPLSSMRIGEHREQKTTTTTTPWVPAKTPTTPQTTLEEYPEEETTTTTTETRGTTKPNILQQGIKTIKTILRPTSSSYDPYPTTSYGSDDYRTMGTGLGGGGAGSIGVETGDIYIKDVIRDISVLVTDVTSCDANVASGCGAGSVCNVTVGPCKVVTPKMNAAPTELSFTRYLSTHTPSIIMVNEAMEPKAPKVVPLQLTKRNDYTMIIEYKSGGIRDISYMFIALPTEMTRVNTIKNLPLGLANYLKTERGTIIKIYKSVGKSSTWTEIAEQKVQASLSDKISAQSNIINVEIAGLGALAVTYRNLKNREGKKIATTRVVYSHFIR